MARLSRLSTAILLGLCVSAWVPVSQAYDRNQPPVNRAAQSLPDMRGQAHVGNLAASARTSPALEASLRDYAQLARRGEQIRRLDEVVSAWAATATYQPSTQLLAERAGVSYRQGQADDEKALAAREIVHRIEVLEAFTGKSFFSFVSSEPRADGGQVLSYKAGAISQRIELAPGEALQDVQLVISPNQRRLLDNSYYALTGSLYWGTLLQARLEPYLRTIDMSIPSSGKLDTRGMVAAFEKQAQVDPVKALGDLQDLLAVAPKSFTDGTGLVELRDRLATEVPVEHTDDYVADFGPDVSKLIPRSKS